MTASLHHITSAPHHSPAPVVEQECPGCGLVMPADPAAAYDGYYNTSPECWSVYAELLGAEYSNAVVFGHAHQMTVDSYAVQHAGGGHKDKSVTVHLVGLHLAIERGVRSPYIPAHLQRLVDRVEQWPHFTPPKLEGVLTVFDVALAESPMDHIRLVQQWASQLWAAWADVHPQIAALVAAHLDLNDRKNDR